MKKSIRSLLSSLGILTLSVTLHAQSLDAPLQDSVACVVADEHGLQRVSFGDLPPCGTFWLISSNAILSPDPISVFDPNFPVYQISDSENVYLVDATAGLVATDPELLATMSQSEAVNASLAAMAANVTSLIDQVQGAVANRALRARLGMVNEMDEEGGDGFTPLLLLDTNSLWLEITNYTPSLAWLNLHNATNAGGVYAILSTTNLATPFAGWTMERELWPVGEQTNVLPFTIATQGRQNWFARAEDITGVDSDGDGIWDFWAWEYWGSVNVTDTNLDYSGSGNTFAWDYSNNVTPTVFQFTGIAVTNNYVNNMSVPVQLAVAGYPYYAAVQIDDTNTALAAWNPYVSSNLTVNLGLTEGWHDVRIGLRGHADDPTNAVWRQQRLNLDFTPPTLVVTSPTVSTVSVPAIQVQGFANETLASLTFDVSNAAGIFTNQPGYVTGQFYDTNLLAYTLSYFECYDVVLTNGVNVIALHANDLTGNTTTTNLSFTLDYATDHTAPALIVIWPPDEAYISGNNFILQAKMDDATAKVTAQIVDASGNTNSVQGLVERNGTVWADNLPLAGGTNTLTVTAIDAAGNVSTTNLVLFQSAITVTMDSLSGDQLNQPTVTATGTVSDPGSEVWINGIQATVNDADGTWVADDVPTGNGRTAAFDMGVYGNGGSPLVGVKAYIAPKPVTVVLMSYAGTQIFNEDNHDPWSDTIYWLYSSGGVLVNTLGDDPAYITAATNGVGYIDFGYVVPMAPPWEYANLNVPSGYYSLYQAQTQTKVMIEPAGQATPDTTRLYLVQAKANEFSADQIYYGDFYDYDYAFLVENPTLGNGRRYGGEVPLPPEWLQINGQTLINSGITNDDGSVWGETFISAPAGTTPEVTPIATRVYANWDYTFDVKAADVNLQLGVDANRDGAITFEAPDRTSASQPYRFWVNNDYDGYNSDIDDYADLDPSTDPAGSDAANTSISCTRDLEDYTRLWINTTGITAELQNGTFLLALEWKNTTGDPKMQFFQAAETNGGALYLTDTNVAAQQVATYGARITEYNSHNVLTKDQPFIFPTNFWANLSADQPVSHLLFDAVGRGSGQLVVAIYKNDGVTKLAEGPPLCLKLQDVKEMYERWSVGNDPSSAPLTTATSVSVPFGYDSSIPAENNYILFVHGWNLADWEKDAFAETAFKRLYWQGYKGHFGSFRWPTGYGISDTLSAVIHARNYDNSESNAWASATGLLGKLNDLNSTYPNHVYLMAHSMGNVVAGEALRQSGSQVVNTYVAMEGAISAHGYDPNTPVWTTSGSTPDIYANYWTNGASSYFDASTGAGTYINFYNANDYALNLWETDQYWKPDHGITSYPGYYFSTPSSTHPSGFYKIVGATIPDIDLFFPTSSHEILAYCVQSQSFALGATANVSGAFLTLGAYNQLNLQTIWPPDLHSGHNYSAHVWHSAEFDFDNMQQANFWSTLLQQMNISQSK